MRELGKFSLLAVALLFAACAKHYESVAVGEFSQKSFSVKKGQVYLLFVSGENLGLGGVNSLNLNANSRENSANTRHFEPALADEKSTAENKSVNLNVDSSHSANAQNDKGGVNLMQNSQNAEKNKNAEVVHFVLTDALGVPKIKKDYAKGEFKSVAFLPPNSAFDELFIELLKRIKAEQNAEFTGTKLEFSFQGYEVKEL